MTVFRVVVALLLAALCGAVGSDPLGLIGWLAGSTNFGLLLVTLGVGGGIALWLLGRDSRRVTPAGSDDGETSGELPRQPSGVP